MTPEEIDTFLAVCEHGTISQAAQALFIGQGTASVRIKNLEAELGVQLFHRHRGVRSASLTLEGQTLRPIAEQMSALFGDARNVRDLAVARELRVTAPDVLNTLVLGPAYREFMNDHPDIFLTVQTEHSSEAHQMVEGQVTDLGFAFTLHSRFPNVIATPLYSEAMVLLFHEGSAFQRSGDLADLRPEDEVYARWSHEFNLWHAQRFSRTTRRRITLGTASMFPLFIGEPHVWAIVSTTLGKVLSSQFPSLRMRPISDPPPDRRCYLLTNRHPKPWVEAIKQPFINTVVHQLAQQNHLRLLYPDSATTLGP